MGERYTYSEASHSQFYQFPKFLMDKQFDKLSNDAKVLYMLLQDRHKLSIKKGWKNSNGEIYLKFKRENMAELLNKSENSIRKIFKQLIDFGLVEEERKGQGQANYIYLCKPELIEESIDLEDFEIDDDKPEISEFIEASDNEKAENFRPAEVEVQDPQDLRFKTLKNCGSKPSEVEVLDPQKLRGNKNDFNKTDYSNNLSINPQIDKMKEYVSIDEFDILYSEIKENIGFEVLMKNYPSDMVEGVVNIITEVLSSPADSFTINQDNISAEIVKERLRFLEREDIEYVLDSVLQQENRIVNIRGYIITSLFNARNTTDIYAQNLFNHKSLRKKE